MVIPPPRSRSLALRGPGRQAKHPGSPGLDELQRRRRREFALRLQHREKVTQPLEMARGQVEREAFFQVGRTGLPTEPDPLVDGFADRIELREAVTLGL